MCEPVIRKLYSEYCQRQCKAGWANISKEFLKCWFHYRTNTILKMLTEIWCRKQLICDLRYSYIIYIIQNINMEFS